jgi:predicted metal-binding membrane protein
MATPNSLRAHFGLRRIPLIAIITYGISLLAWIAIIRQWLPMPGMVSGLRMSDPGAPEAMALSNGLVGVGLYLLMWGVMMVAMMYPSSIPLFRLYYNSLNETTTAGTAGRVGAFMGTYVLVWTATGVVPLGVNTVVPIAAISNEHSALLFGGTLLILSLYQLSPYKDRCLRYCRTPLGFLMDYHKPGIRGAAAMSFRYSVFCVGCCWALFAVIVVVGSMNILWMAGITVVLSLERVVGWGDRLAEGVGVTAGIGGVIAILIGFV